jgi:hypothetical protein
MSYDARQILFLKFCFLYFCIGAFILYVGAYKEKQAHVNIGDPDQREPCNHVTPPIEQQQLVLCYKQHQGRYIETEAIFAGEQVKKFSMKQGFPGYALLFAIIPGLGENFFVRNRPCNAGDR